MKRLLTLTLVLSITVHASSQNVDDQNIAFNYVQLPSKPIKNTSEYTIVVDHSAYRQSNQDSLDAYEIRQSVYESLLKDWMEQKKKIDKTHLLEMAKWEKATNAGTAMTMPVQQPYPPMPMKDDFRSPVLTTDISEDVVNNTINIDGLEKTTGAGGATITISFMGFQDTKITQKIKGSGASTKYEYKASYRMPIMVTLKAPGQGMLITQTINSDVKTIKLKTYASKYEYEYWKIDNLDAYWKTLQTNALNDALKSINTLLNNECGFPIKNRSTEIFTVKKHKGHNYSDLIDAYVVTKQGYNQLSGDNSRQEANKNIQKGIKIWEEALTESTDYSKARINEKVTALLYVNLAEAYLWMNDFLKAETYMEKAKVAGVLKYKNEANRLQSVASDLKARYRANQ